MHWHINKYRNMSLVKQQFHICATCGSKKKVAHKKNFRYILLACAVDV